MSRPRWISGVAFSLGALGGCDFSDSDAAENPPPVIASQSYAGSEDTALEAQVIATDPGDTLTFVVDGAPLHGKLVRFESGGAFRYEPNANFSGLDAFVVRAVDSAGGNAVTVVRLNVAPSNDAPVAVDDVLAVPDANSLTILANDAEPDGDPLTIELLGVPFAGIASVTPGNTVHLQLPAAFKGFTRFRYRISDPTGLSSEATALVFVGIEPFKLVYLGTEGIFINDLLSTRRASAPESTAVSKIENMKVAASGKALAYLLREDDGHPHLKYVDLENPGVARALEPSVADPSKRINYYEISDDGRYVVAEQLDDSADSLSSTLLFDARSTGALTQIGVKPHSAFMSSTLASFNAESTRVYYLARASLGCEYEACSDGHAIYRMDLATGVSTRVSPARGLNDAVTRYSLSRDETLLLEGVYWGEYPPYRYSNANLVDVARPDSAIQLNLGFGPEVVSHSATMSPDGGHVFLGISTAQPRVQTLLLSMRLVRTRQALEFIEIAPACCPLEFTFAMAGATMRADSRAMLLGFSGNLYELSFADPANPVVVNTPAVGNERIVSERYSSDNERIFYLRRGTAAQVQILEMTRRDAIGTSVPLTPLSEAVADYLLEPSGHVALVVGARGGEWPYGLVNADVPQSILAVGGPGAVVDVPVVHVALVPR